MWVADMDFPTAPAIREALERRVAHGVFGYATVPDAWYDSILNWWRDRHGVSWKREWLIFVTGVVPAISSCVRRLTVPAENVVVQPPVYNIFYNSIRNNGRNVLESPLVIQDGAYTIDWDDLESKLALPQTRMMILCNPHNPVGKLWSRETLGRIGALCAKYHVMVLSDEIHCDLTDPGKAYFPFSAASPECLNNSVTCIAPTKAFNIAGLQTACVVIPDPDLRHKVWRALNNDEVAEPNAFAVDAAVAAFTSGGEWLDALRGYLYENKRTVADFLAAHLPQIRLTPSDATYLLWLDCRAVSGDSVRLAERLRALTGLYLSDGAQYGTGGDGFLRLNIACPHSTLTDGLSRLSAGIRIILQEETAGSR